MKNKKAALFDPYLDTLGGGERHVLSIMQVLAYSGYDIDIFWDKNLDKEIKTRLNIHFPSPPQFISGWSQLSFWERNEVLSQYDILLTVTDGSYFYSSAKKTFIFCMVPLRKLYHMHTLNRLKTLRSSFISNSLFTRSCLAEWGVSSSVLYPFVPDDFFNLNGKKEQVILNVGRFFKHLHSKRQDHVIEWFIHFKDNFSSFRNLKLVLCGGANEHDMSYVEELKKMIQGRTDIEIKVNLSYQELLYEYDRAKILWHFTGMDVDEKKHPEKTEHLGITPLEAMAAQCVPIAYAAGGPIETIRDGENGFLFKDQEELFKKTTSILTDDTKIDIIKKQSRISAEKLFSYKTFQHEVESLMLKD